MRFDAHKLKAERLKNDMTHRELAEHASLPVSTLRHIESGRQVPSADRVGALASALDCEIGDFYE